MWGNDQFHCLSLLYSLLNIRCAGVELVKDWAKVDDLMLGQIGGVATDSQGNVHIFHRGSRVWDGRWAAFDLEYSLIFALYFVNFT